MYQRISELVDLLDKSQPGPVVLAGDFMLDEYLYGDAERISPEAPVPVLRVVRREVRLGGAGAVAASLRGLGCTTYCAGIVGADRAGDQVRGALAEAGSDLSALLVDDSLCTPRKQRLVGLAQHRIPQQLLRVDHEQVDAPGEDILNELKDRLADVLSGAAVLAVQDYDKGLFGNGLCEWLVARGRKAKIPVIVDPARLRDWSRYRGADIVTPNRFEASLASGIEIKSLDQAREAGTLLRDRFGIGSVLITLDCDGIVIAGPTGCEDVATEPLKVFDNTGAGDVVLAAISFALAAGMKLSDAAILANVAGGWEVQQSGAVPITGDQLQWELLSRQRSHRGKLIKREQLVRELQLLRQHGRRIVFTNGCFDLLHPGHVSYLEFARRQGDILVVGMNSDRSIKANKGPSRPLINEEDRARMLAALETVDYVVVFDDPSVLSLVEDIRPDVLVKGQDYTVDGVVGHQFVQDCGGVVVLAPIERQYSTSDIIETIISRTAAERAKGSQDDRSDTNKH